MNRLGPRPGPSAGFLLVLSDAQVEYARRVAHARQESNERLGRSSALAGRRLNDSDTHVVGAICEVAVAVAEGRRRLGCSVHAGGGFRSATGGDDVGPWEIKGTDRAFGRLLVPADDRWAHKRKPHARYLLVRWLAPTAQIVGWQLGSVFLVESCIDRGNGLPTPAFVAPWLWEYERIIAGEQRVS